MRQMFNYTHFNDEVADGIVESFCALAQKAMEGKSNSAEYQTANAELNETFMRFCVEAIPGTKFNSMDDVKNPMIHNNMFFVQKFNTILAQAITPIIPAIVAAGYQDLYDVTQVGYGDNARYTVESNELFIVNDLAEGILRGGVQADYATEYSVQAHRRQIAVFVDWYQVAAGKVNWGERVNKIGASYAAYVQGLVVKAMASSITNAADHGISGYIANGMSDTNWLTTARNVELANGGARVYALGTKIALAEVLPAESAVSGFRYGENSAIVRDGFLPTYKDVPLIELGNALVPNTINGTPEVVVPDDIIYMVPMGMHKPVKVVIEGDTVSVEKDQTQNADHGIWLSVDIRIGADVVVGSKFGAIQLT